MATVEKLRKKFKKRAQALYDVTHDGTELYDLVHQVIHPPSSPSPGTDAKISPSPATGTTLSPSPATGTNISPSPGIGTMISTSPAPKARDAKSHPPTPAALPKPTARTPTSSKRRAISEESPLNAATPETNVTPEQEDPFSNLLNQHFPVKTSSPQPETPSKKTKTLKDSRILRSANKSLLPAEPAKITNNLKKRLDLAKKAMKVTQGNSKKTSGT